MYVFFRELPLFVAMGFFGMFANQLMYILGVYNTSADIASMFQPLAACWTVIVAVAARVERFPNLSTVLGASKVIGIIVATAGAVLMNFGKSTKHNKTSNNSVSSSSSLFGYCALVINTLSVGIYVVLQKKYIFSVATSRWRTCPIGVTAWAYLFGFISMGFASLYYVRQPEKFHLQANGVVYTLIYAVFIASAMCYMLITWCNMLVSSTLVAASWPLQVFFCIILSYFILGETLSVLETIGGLMIIFAMLAVVWSNYQTELLNLNRPEQKILNPHTEGYDKLTS